ncbi:hypothetical protein FKW77_008517 [Venturia effusa]|uniref:Heterokaryon incompatibility domain-containing protein n=1 Tax=Venturia effusa TaxID=50376 RepID=A0A517L7V1_9PEZI|nr:hypothetical protein FKW77_008517 [Venturia effusa]
MGHIYQNGYVTIAATHARDGTVGLHAEARPSSEARALPSKHLYVRQNWDVIHRNLSSYPDPGCPLLSRGWTLQERLLSPRVVHFLDRKVVWECQHGMKQADRTTFEDHWSKLLPIKHHGWSEVDLIELWHDIVVECSQKDLTFEDDRLPSIAALAQRILLLRPDDEYLAGLWKSTLLQDLVWHCGPSRMKAAAPEGLTKWNPPSWSWVAVVAGSSFVGYPLGELIAGTTVISVTYVQTGPAHLGQITDAKIVIQAHLLLFDLPTSLRRYPLVDHVFPPGSIEIPPPSNAEKNQGSPTVCLCVWRFDHPGSYYSGAAGGADSLEAGDQSTTRLYLLPLLRPYSTSVNCLILREVSPGIFRRIGFAEIECRAREIDKAYMKKELIERALSQWPLTRVELV